MAELVFLKLGGSLITDKTRPYTARPEKLAGLACQIAAALQANPELSLVLGHGSGSFGHTAALEYHTREGLHSQEREAAGHYWNGFAQVWFQAATLNRLVIGSLHQAGISCVALAPVSAVSARNGKVARWDLAPIKAALAARLVPVVYGDVIFDQQRGGTILSTEDLFVHLAGKLRPHRLLLAGMEGAVWADFPERTQKLEKITPVTFDQIKSRVGASHAADVTGGMESKVRQMLGLVAKYPEMTAQIFSGEESGNVLRVLTGESLGTILAGA